MVPTEEFYKLVTDGPNGEGFVPRDNISEEEMEELKELNKDYKEFYGIDLITFN